MNSKGKQRAVDTGPATTGNERTPLLAGSVSSYASNNTIESTEAGHLIQQVHTNYDDDDSERATLTRRQRWNATLTQVLKWLSVLIIVAFFALIIFLVVLWATVNSAPAARQQLEAIVIHATKWRTVSMEVLRVNDGDIDVSVSGELGVDTEWILGVDPKDQSSLAYARRAAGRWLVTTLGGARTSTITTVSVFDDDGVFLVNCTTYPFSAQVLPNNPHTQEIRMAPVRLRFGISPTTNSEDLIRFANLTWLQTAAKVSLHAQEVVVQAARKPWWLPRLTKTVRDVSTNLQINCGCRSTSAFLPLLY